MVDLNREMINLDREAIIIVQKLLEKINEKKRVTDIENQLTKSLGILTESGVYALFVYLLAKRKKKKNGGGEPKEDPCHLILKHLFDALRENDNLCTALGLEKEKLPSLENLPQDGDAKKVLNWATGQVGDLGRLLLLRDFLLRVFTCGRYCAEARETELKATATGAGGGGATP